MNEYTKDTAVTAFKARYLALAPGPDEHAGDRVQGFEKCFTVLSDLSSADKILAIRDIENFFREAAYHWREQGSATEQLLSIQQVICSQVRRYFELLDLSTENAQMILHRGESHTWSGIFSFDSLPSGFARHVQEAAAYACGLPAHSFTAPVELPPLSVESATTKQEQPGSAEAIVKRELPMFDNDANQSATARAFNEKYPQHTEGAFRTAIRKHWHLRKNQ